MATEKNPNVLGNHIVISTSTRHWSGLISSKFWKHLFSLPIKSTVRC